MTRVIIGLGSNLGNRAQHLERAIAAMRDCLDGIRLSAIWESAALLSEGAPADWDMPFYNMALSADTRVNPQGLLAACKRVEMQLGRKQRERWAPREIDMDILAYGEEIIQTGDLVIPHPYLLQRDFALLPLAELWPDWRYPGAGEFYRKTAADMVAQLGYSENTCLRRVTVKLDAA